MTDDFLDQDTPLLKGLIRDIMTTTGLPDIETVRARLAAYGPRDSFEATLAAQLVRMDWALATPHITPRIARHMEIMREQSLRMLRKRQKTPPASPARLPLKERLKVHLVDGGTSVH